MHTTWKSLFKRGDEEKSGSFKCTALFLGAIFDMLLPKFLFNVTFLLTLSSLLILIKLFRWTSTCRLGVSHPEQLISFCIVSFGSAFSLLPSTVIETEKKSLNYKTIHNLVWNIINVQWAMQIK